MLARCPGRGFYTFPVDSTDRDFSSWALLLIDVQQDFWTPTHRQVFPDFEHNVAELLATCRRLGIEVVHVRSRFQPDRSDWMLPHRVLGRIPCITGTPGVEVVPFAVEQPEEAVFEKHTYDAFFEPGLAEHLRSRGRRILLTAGLETSYCVLFTTVAASQQGFLPLMVEDCCADDPGFDRATTTALLDRYEPKVFWRTTLHAFRGEYSTWMQKLERSRGGGA